MLIRKQILLNSQINHDLESLSILANRSVSELIRRLLPPQIEKERKKYKKVRPANAAKLMLEMAKSAKKLNLKGPRDLSINHDHYLYGAPKRV